MNQNELYHHGVKGMKWGVRKAVQTSDTYNRYKNTKAEAKAAKKQYSKDFNSAYNYSSLHPLGQFISKKKSAESNSRWEKAYDSANKYESAKAEYKKAKADRKAKINKTTNKINKQASFKDKLLYNNATRKQAAKYVVDNNMSVADANKKAKSDANRNTLAFVAGYGAIAVGAYLYNNR